MDAMIAERTLQNGGKAGAYCAFADVEFQDLTLFDIECLDCALQDIRHRVILGQSLRSCH